MKRPSFRHFILRDFAVAALLTLVMSALALLFFGCSPFGSGSASATAPGLRAEVSAAPRVARAAVDEARKQLDKPAPSVDQARPMLDIAAAALPESDQPARDLVAGVVADNGKLREAVARAELLKAKADDALTAAVAESARLREQLESANARPLYWVSAIVGGALIVAGAAVAAFGAQLGIARGPLIGGTLGAFGLSAFGAMLFADRLARSAQLSTALWLLVASLAVALAYVLWRWIVSGKTLAAAVRATDALKASAPPEAVAAFEATAGRAMDSAHKAVVRLAREVIT